MERAWSWNGKAVEAQGDWEGQIGHEAGQDLENLRQSFRYVCGLLFLIVLVWCSIGFDGLETLNSSGFDSVASR